jgi:hypothetical protein
MENMVSNHGISSAFSVAVMFRHRPEMKADLYREHSRENAMTCNVY